MDPTLMQIFRQLVIYSQQIDALRQEVAKLQARIKELETKEEPE